MKECCVDKFGIPMEGVTPSPLKIENAFTIDIGKNYASFAIEYDEDHYEVVLEGVFDEDHLPVEIDETIQEQIAAIEKLADGHAIAILDKLSSEKKEEE